MLADLRVSCKGPKVPAPVDGKCCQITCKQLWANTTPTLFGNICDACTASTARPTKEAQKAPNSPKQATRVEISLLATHIIPIAHHFYI